VISKTVIALLLGATLAGSIYQVQPGASTMTTSDAASVPFDPSRLEELQRSGTPVFVNFTAAWCITCMVNEQVAISRPKVQAQLRAKGVVYMKGDWTNRNPQITAVLDRYERSGVPLYLLYPGNDSDAEVLPNILTEGILLDSIAKIKTP
jgi:thiol:disulfide interchange protein DsbD